MNRVKQTFVGVTSWNSAQFLPVCLESIRQTTSSSDVRICVLDNQSVDESAEIAQAHDAEVVVQRCTQADALNRLVEESQSPYTLLIHADVVLLAPDWLDRCIARFEAGAALVSPEDIGCGPWSRPFGVGMPESSFMFFKSASLRRIRKLRLRRTWPPLRYEVDFAAAHVTHGLPGALADAGLQWHAMRVHCSEVEETEYFRPSFEPSVWSNELGRMRYGLGNFYSLDGAITHYHNWYDRIDHSVPLDSSATVDRDGKGFPKAFIRDYSERFLRDWRAGTLELPARLSYQRPPRAL